MENKLNNLLILMQHAFDAMNNGGNGSELLTYSNKVLELDATNDLATLYKGLAHIWLFSFEQGMVYLEKAIQLNDSSDFKQKLYDATIKNAPKFFNHFYNNWNRNANPDEDHHPSWQDREDNTYLWNTTKIIEWVEYVIKLFPEKHEGHLVIVKGLRYIEYFDWSQKIQQHQEAMIALGFKSPLTEQLQKKEKKKKDEGCFIATAALGDYDHPVVIDLRIFRDNTLLKKEWGKKFVNYYYKYGSIAAKWIEKSKVAKVLTFHLIVRPLHFFVQLISKQK
jgi:tetratricopeptide (TPR) repeat protein